MCGIVGYAGIGDALKIVIEALKRLEYRGYDSAGIAIRSDRGLKIVKSVGEIGNLENRVRGMSIKGATGIAHTRWATHGIPSEVNAHPHPDCRKKIALVHNGIIENYRTLRKELLSRGHEFRSETDTEVVVHLVEERYYPLRKKGIEDALFVAVREVIPLLEGSYALVVVAEDEDYLVGVREKSPLVIGIGSGENFLASDVSPLLKYTSEVVYLDDGECARLDRKSFRIVDKEGNTVQPGIHQVDWSPKDAEKGGYEHFMLKEINEQAGSLHDTFVGMTGENFTLSPMLKTLVPYLKSIEIIGCGTSYNAGMVGKYFIESLTRIPVGLCYASEYRYSSPAEHTPLIIAISQSGETADTLAAMREARRRGSVTIAITNVVGSTITREADFTLYTRAGPEIGVAATKTFTAQIMVLDMLGLRLFEAKKGDPAQLGRLEGSLRGVPRLVQKVLENQERIKEVSRFLSKAHTIFFIGRNINYPTAVEGALKLKEISYIHAEAYPAGELKHGPLALLSPETPVVAVAASDHVREKLYSNVGEVCAREAPVVIVAEEGDETAWNYTDDVLT
ncbi:MAG: glutamine--fructose-6-phosphate transaminase (isomerizing), partial [Thermoplasmata archaeon]|nr:glutamine--fructose-6-phosphate transaminase (isomerizing) [Thermoplasmata archaeon]